MTAVYNLKFIESMVALKPAPLPLDIAKLLSDISKKLPASSNVGAAASTNTHRSSNNGRYGRPVVTVMPPLTQQQKEDPAAKVRLLLNKLTDKNYDEYSNIILRTLTLYDITAENAAEILHIGIQNQFYVKIYAKLFAAILADTKLVSLFSGAVTATIDAHMAALSAPFEYVAQSDYDGFCKMNAAIDRRKSTTNFLVHLAQLGSISYDIIGRIAAQILTKIAAELYDESIKNQMDELCEHIFTICTNAGFVAAVVAATIPATNYTEPVTGTEYTLFDFIGYLTKCSIKTQKGLTSKAKFKFNDTYDAIKLLL